jgi:hypothetical protein
MSGVNGKPDIAAKPRGCRLMTDGVEKGLVIFGEP